MTTSAFLTASLISKTLCPALLALSHDAPPFLRATVTLTPDSLRLAA